MSTSLSLPSFKGRPGPNLAAPAEWLFFAALLAVVLLTRSSSYLLFHSLAELFSIVIAFGVFIIAWNSDPLVKNGYLLILGVGSLFIAVIDSIHAFAFKGMGVFAGNDANLPTQLWLAARYLQALTWLIAPLFIHRNVKRLPVAMLFAFATLMLFASIFVWKIFPTAYMDGSGLTRFKTISEYVIIGILVAAIGLLWWRRSQFDSTVLSWLIGSLVAAIAAEFTLTLYVGVTDAANLVGHIFKIVEFYLLYQALVVIGFTRPYSLLFRQVKKEGDAQVKQERVLAEGRAAELDAVFSSMTDGVILYAPDGTVLRANAAGSRIFDFSSASIDQPMARRARLHSFIDEDGLPVDDMQKMPVPRALSGEVVHDVVLGLPNAITGEVLWLANSAAPVRDAAGQIRGAVLTSRDITERQLAAEKLDQLNLELERLVRDRTVKLEATNKELEEFAHLISHDLRLPLRNMDSFVRLLQEQAMGTLDPLAREYIGRIAASAREVDTLIDDLLVFSRLGHAELCKTTVDLGGLVQEVIDQFRPETEGRHVEWHIAPLPRVTADPGMLRIVLVNLVSNALKFTGPRPVAQIEIGLEPNGPARTVVFIRDNGVGFDMQYADKIFGVFQRLQPVENFEGTGIGLANVRRIIGRHGGQTWAEGKIDVGATFYFSLPKAT